MVETEVLSYTEKAFDYPLWTENISFQRGFGFPSSQQARPGNMKQLISFLIAIFQSYPLTLRKALSFLCPHNSKIGKVGLFYQGNKTIPSILAVTFTQGRLREDEITF